MTSPPRSGTDRSIKLTDRESSIDGQVKSEKASAGGGVVFGFPHVYGEASQTRRRHNPLGLIPQRSEDSRPADKQAKRSASGSENWPLGAAGRTTLRSKV